MTESLLEASTEVSVLDSSLIQALQQIRDHRSKQGRRYPLWLMLLLCLLGVMSGCQSYQALEDFGIRHCVALSQVLGLSSGRMPSDTTLRMLFRKLSFEQLNEQFMAWAQEQYPTQAQEWFALDGKSIRGTVVDGQQAFQNFVSLVSVYSHQRRIVVGQQSYQHKAESEIEVVRALLTQLQLQDVVFTFDALHAQKNSRFDCVPGQ